MLKAFIFDMDGVIIDSEPLHFDVDLLTLEYFGVTATQEQLEPYVGMTNPEMWNLIRTEYNLASSVEEIIEYQLTKKLDVLRAMTIDPIEGIRELIDSLNMKHIPIAVASSSPRIFIEEVLTKFNLLEKFHFIISGEEVAKGKPAPDIYLEAARLLEVDTDQCVVLEDSCNGIRAAKDAGMYCVGYINPNSGNQDLSNADEVVSFIREINILALPIMGYSPISIPNK